MNPKTLFAMIKVARPTHWIKNMSLFAALIFTGTLFIPSYFVTVVLAFFSFSFAASAAYIFNDTLDINRDRLHPIKKDRPIAKGTLPVQLALTESLISSVVNLAVLSLYSVGQKKRR